MLLRSGKYVFNMATLNQNQNITEGHVEDNGDLLNRVGTLEATTHTLETTTQDINAKVDRLTTQIATLINEIRGNRAADRIEAPPMEEVLDNAMAIHRPRPQQQDRPRASLPKAILPPFTGNRGIED